MAERRRIIPSSVGPLFPLKKEKETVPTLRFSLTLKEPDDKTYSAFSYCQLVKNAAHKEKDSNGINQSFNELDEDDISGLESIAKNFEEKYAPKKGKKRKRAFLDDLIDVGMGYDETDPFVDNSECYDELVPDVLTTQLGGFYINQGQLHFRERSDSENSGDLHDALRRKKTPKKKHRKSADGEKKEGKRKRNSSSSSDKAAKKMRKQLQRQLGKPGRKKKSLPGRVSTVAELLKQKEEAKHYGTSEDSMKETTATSNATKAPPNNASATATNGLPPSSMDDIDLNASLGDIDPSLDLGLIMSDLKMDSDMAAAMEEALKGPMSTDETERGLGSPGPNDEDVLDADGKAPLPAGLPASLVSNVDKIKEAARKSVEGKCKFFTASVNNLLLKIENQSRDQSCGIRSSLYNHLASNLPCTKETLLKRAKKLRLMAHDSCLKEPLQKLKGAIAKAMPAQLDRYQQECQAAAQDKYNAMMNKSQSGEDEIKTKGTRGQVPSRRFQWTDEIRELLCTIVNVKMQTYKMSKIRTQSAEDYLKMYLEDEIKPLWVSGWMQTRTLFKESRSVHGTITSIAPKPRKILPILKKPTPTKTSTQEALDSNADEPDFHRKQDRPDARITSPDSSQDSYIRTFLDYASKSPDPQPTSEKDKSDPKPSNRPKTTNAPDNVVHRLKDSRDFVDLLIAEQLALHDKLAESKTSQPPKKAREEGVKSQSKREVAATPSTRMTAEEDPQALQLDILRKASLLLQPQDSWSGESSRKGLSPYADEIKALAQVASQKSSSVAGNSVGNTQSVAVHQKPSSLKMAGTAPQNSFQMEFEKNCIMGQKGNPSQVQEVIKPSPAAHQKYNTFAPHEVSLSGNAKTASHKTAFEKLRLAGQGIPSVDLVSVTQPVVKLTRHANLSGGVKLDTAVHSPYKLVSPPSTHYNSGFTSKREPLTSSHRLPQQGNTPTVTSTSQSLPVKIPSSQPLSSAGSLYLTRKDSAFQSVSQAGDRSVSSKHTGKLVPSPAYTSPSPPKGSPHSVRTSPYSTSPSQVTPPPSSPRRTSPLGQKPSYSQYQHTSSTSPGHSSYSTSYPASMPNLPGYLGDLTRKQPATSPVFAPSSFLMTTGHVSPGHQGSSGRSTSPGDAIITGPAPGTHYHTQNAEPHRKQKQHRIP